MADWEALRTFVTDTYVVAKEGDGLIEMVFTLGGDRSQLVLVARSTAGDGTDFATIASPVGNVDEYHLPALLREASEYVVGGVVAYGNRVMVRHAVPLADLDASEFDVPLRHVIRAADAIEAKFLGTDAN